MLKSAKYSTGQSPVLLIGFALKRPQLLPHLSLVSTQKVRRIEIVTLFSKNGLLIVKKKKAWLVAAQRSCEPDRFPALEFIVFCIESCVRNAKGTLFEISAEGAVCSHPVIPLYVVHSGGHFHSLLFTLCKDVSTCNQQLWLTLH